MVLIILWVLTGIWILAAFCAELGKGIITVGLAFAALMAMRTGLWYWQKRRHERAEDRLRFDAEGRPRPPLAKGLCSRCGGSFLRVYYLPNRRRLCPECFKIEHPQ